MTWEIWQEIEALLNAWEDDRADWFEHHAWEHEG